MEDGGLYRSLFKKRQNRLQGNRKEIVIASPRKAGEAISAVGQTINRDEQSWERMAKYKQGTEIATSLPKNRKLLAMTRKEKQFEELRKRQKTESLDAN
jgi:hypothetical protein